MNRQLEILQKLEKDLNLKQLQIKSLLNITQAINENLSAQGLYSMYESFLGWEMGVGKMALLVNEDDVWQCKAQILTDGEQLLDRGVISEALQIKRLTTVKNKGYDVLSDFDIVVPVYHKELPLSFALIGGMKDNEDLYDKLQFITTITNIVTVAIENKRLFNTQLEQEKYKKEIELASEVQKMLIPEGMPQVDYCEIASIYQPHYNVGGDYIDVIKLRDGNLLLCIADISGKGVSAALLMANFQALIHTLIHKHTDLEALVRDINASVNKITKGDKYLTFFIAMIQKDAMQMQYINAGHFPPFLVDGDTQQRLELGTTVIGAFDELPFVELGKTALDSGMVLLAFTDGLTDITNDEGEYFSDAYVSEFLTDCKSDDASEMTRKLQIRMEEFKGSSGYPDDIAVLTCKFDFNSIYEG